MNTYDVEVVFRGPSDSNIVDIKSAVNLKSEKEAKALCLVVENIFDMPDAIKKAVAEVLSMSPNFNWDTYTKVSVELFENEVISKKIDWGNNEV